MKAESYDFQLLTFHWSGLSSELRVSFWLIVLFLVIGAFCAMLIYFPKMLFFRNVEVVELKIKLGNVGTVKIKPNNQVRQIAHKAWVELVTRKAGIPVDRENDVISDVYASWYELFKEIRLLAREVPANKLTDPDTKKLVDILIQTLNKGLRPHLTQWQAKYKRWYNSAVDSDKKSALTPQDIQKNYPKYDDLVDDMLKVNKFLVDYAVELKKLLN